MAKAKTPAKAPAKPPKGGKPVKGAPVVAKKSNDPDPGGKRRKARSAAKAKEQAKAKKATKKATKTKTTKKK
jgi:hypothetical protein